MRDAEYMWERAERDAKEFLKTHPDLSSYQ